MLKQDKNSSQELPIDYKDSQEIFLKQGKIIGSVKLFDVINIENITKEIKNEFREEIKKAKGILIHFESFNDISLFTINDFISSVREDTFFDCKVVFGTKRNHNIETNSCLLQIIFSGL
jgi:cell division GTPase FtsZ